MRFLILIAAVIAAIAGYYAYWTVLANRIEAGTAEWIAAQAADGTEFSHQGLDVSGFPYRLTVSVDRPRIIRQDGQNGFDWQADWLTAYIQPWKLTHVIAVFEGEHLVYWQRGADEDRLSLLPETAQASLQFDKSGRLLRLIADIRAAAVESAAYGAGRVGRLQLAGRPAEGVEAAEAIDFSIMSSAVSLAPGQGGPLGDDIETFNLTGTAAPPPPPEVTSTTLRGWQRSGGRITIDDIQLVWGPASLGGRGQVGLDPVLRPAGKLDATLRGLDGTLDAFVAAGQMAEQDAAAAKIALLLVTKRDENGGFVETSLRADQGQLFLGPIPLAPLAPVVADP